MIKLNVDVYTIKQIQDFCEGTECFCCPFKDYEHNSGGTHCLIGIPYEAWKFEEVEDD